MKNNQLSVLIVDDQPLIVELASKAFEKKGYAVETANSGASALDILKTHVPDMALVDIVMPGMNGMELLANIKQSARTQTIEVYMFSSYSDEQNVAESKRLGAVEFISKQGLSLQSLLKRIDGISLSLLNR